MPGEVEVRLRALQEEFSNIKELQDHVGWVKLMEFAEEQLVNRTANALGPTTNLLEVLTKEYERGEISGIQLFRRMPGVYQAAIEEDINLLEKELENEPRTEDRAGNTDAASGDAGGDFKPAI